MGYFLGLQAFLIVALPEKSRGFFKLVFICLSISYAGGFSANSFKKYIILTRSEVSRYLGLLKNTRGVEFFIYHVEIYL